MLWIKEYFTTQKQGNTLSLHVIQTIGNKFYSKQSYDVFKKTHSMKIKHNETYNIHMNCGTAVLCFNAANDTIKIQYEFKWNLSFLLCHSLRIEKLSLQ